MTTATSVADGHVTCPNCAGVFEVPPEHLEVLSRDLKKAAETMTPAEARYFVDAYYIHQENRKRSANQEKALGEGPHEIIRWLLRHEDQMERHIRTALDVWSTGKVPGRWAKSLVGIGPVIAAGLLAHIDIEQAPTVGHIWRFAGLDPTDVWGEGEKRPWNATLKTLCWKIGESFTKTSNHEGSVYGPIYAKRKLQEIQKNELGDFADQARRSLETKDFGKDTEARVWYSARLTAEHSRAYYLAPAGERLGLVKRLAGEPGSGVAMLPPARLHLRAQRYAVKLFLAHFHHVLYEDRYGVRPPKPYVISRLGHAHYMAPPNWPIEPNVRGVPKA